MKKLFLHLVKLMHIILLRNLTKELINMLVVEEVRWVGDKNKE